MKYFCNFRWSHTRRFFWRQKYPDNFSEQMPGESQPRCLHWYPQQESLQFTQEGLLLNLHARWGTMQHSQESPVMVWWSSLGNSSFMGSTESWYEYHREFVDPVEARSCKLPAATHREELKERILSAWKNLERRHDALKNLCDSMPRHVSALVQSRGGPIKY